MDASEDNLFRAATQRRLDIENDIRNGTTTSFATRDGSDAERAMIITAILHFDEGARATMQARQRLARDGFKVKRFLWKI